MFFAQLSFFTSDLVESTVEYFHLFESVTAPAESVVLPPLRSGVYFFVANIGLFSVLQGSQCEFKEACRAYHRRRKVD